MKYLFSASLFSLASLFAAPALAQSGAESLSSCLADHTTGKDRKELAQWIFVGMSAHPEIQPLANVSPAKRDEFDKKLAKLSMRLLTENCVKEAKAAITTDGPQAFETAFQTLGRLAMQELTTHPQVAASFSNYAKHLDKAKLEATFSQK